VIVIDEASQVSTADLARIWQVADAAGARIQPVGDTEQLGPVEAGGIFRVLAARYGTGS
jgi:ATP-dependent exoDNAse (exonuclease V) alpha subunit